ncbi:hypothetical protein [Streptomyces sp. YIM S03343]
MLPADMVTGLKANAETLLSFKQRIDKLLEDFEGSPGSPSEVAALRIPRASLSGHGIDFHEADDLFDQCEWVHSELTRLSKLLGMQLEGIGIATQGAAHKFTNLDEDQRRRFHEIQMEVGRQYKEAQRKKSGEARREQSNTSGTEKGYN